MRRSLVLLPLLLAACAGAQSGGGTSNALTLCIENATAGYGNVVARVESARFEVLPGRTLCRELNPASATPRLTAVTTSGGAAGPLRFATMLPSSGGCWHWRLSGHAEGALLPCDGENL